MKRLALVMLAGIMALVWALPVLAATYITQPTSMGVLSAKAFSDLAADGDTSIIVHWSIPYGTGDNITYPEVPASLSILIQFVSIDGTTVLGTASPFVFAAFGTNGYYQGVSEFYFTSTDNLTSGGAYQIRIVQSPIYYETPVSTSYTMAATDWLSTSEVGFYNHVIQLCDLLLAAYPNVALKTSTDVGLVLSTYGESYFRAAMPGIQTLCPQLFYVQDYQPSEMTVTPYDSTLQDQYSLRLQGSEIKRGADRMASYFGVTGYFVLGMVILAACIICAVWTMKKGWGLEPGMIGASIISICGAVVLGNAVFTIVMIGTLIAAIALMFTFFGRRA